MSEGWDHLRDRVGIWFAERFCVQPMSPFRRQLAAYVIGDIGDDERCKLEHHLDQCYRCSAEVRELRVLLDENLKPLADACGTLGVRGEPEVEAALRAILGETRAREPRRLGRGRPGRARLLPTAAVLGGILVAVAAAAFWGGARIANRTATTDEALNRRLLLHSGAALASQLILQEPLLDVRTSFGPERPAVAMLFDRGPDAPIGGDDAESLEALLESRVRQGPRDARIAATAAVISVFRRNPSTAREMMAKALAQAAPGDAPTLVDAGVVAFLLSDFATAESAFRRALDADPSNPEALYDLARLCEVTGRTEAAHMAWLAYTAVDSLSLWSELAGVRVLETEERTKGYGPWPPWKNPAPHRE